MRRSVIPDVPLMDAVRDPNLLGSTPFHPTQLDLLAAIAEHSTVVVSAGRRSGKSRVVAAAALHSLLLSDRLDALIPEHEPRYALVVANSVEQATVVRDLALALARSSPVLRGELELETQVELVFRRGRVLRVLPCNSRTVRGLAASFVAFDEFGHFLTESEGPAVAERVWAALTPSVAQFRGEGRVLATSTPGDDAGLFASLFLRAENGELPGAVAFGPVSTREMNVGIPEDYLAAQLAALGPDSFAREFEGRFVAGGGRFFEPDDVRAVVSNRREALPSDGHSWTCAIDPSSGGGDPFACVVVGRDARPGFEGRLLVGHVERWAPRRTRSRLSLRTRSERDLWVDAVLDRVAEIAKRFRAEVISDQHIPGVVLDELRKRDVPHVRIAPWTATTRTEALQALRARIATERIELTADEQLVSELVRVRNKFRAGSSVVEVPRVGDSHGDLAVALAAAVYALDRHGVGGHMTFHAPTGGRIRTPRFRVSLRELDELALPHSGAQAVGETGKARLDELRRSAGASASTAWRPELYE